MAQETLLLAEWLAGKGLMQFVEMERHMSVAFQAKLTLPIAKAFAEVNT